MRADDYYREVQNSRPLPQPLIVVGGSNAIGLQQSQEIAASEPDVDKGTPTSTEPDVVEIGENGGLEFRFTVSVTSVRRLETLTREPAASLYLYYQLFDADCRFPLPEFGKSVTARSFVLRTSAEDLRTYFGEFPVEIYLCAGATAIGACQVPVSALIEQWLKLEGRSPQAIVESFAVNRIAQPNASRTKDKATEVLATMGVTVEMDAIKGVPQTVPLQQSAGATLPLDNVPDSPPRDTVAPVVKYDSSPMALLKGSLKMSRDPPAAEESRDYLSSPSAYQVSPIRSSSENQDKLLEPSQALVELDYTSTSMSESISSSNSVASSGTATSSSSCGGSNEHRQPPRNAPSSIGPEYAKLYRITIECTALKGLLPSHVLRSAPNLEDYLNDAKSPEVWLYARFEYPLLFGSAHIFSNPTPYARRTNDGRALTIVKKPELGGSLFSIDFAMSERNLSVALRECSLGVEIWRMARAPHVAGDKVHQTTAEDEFVGIAVVPLSAVVGIQAKRQSIGDGEVAFLVHDYFPVLPEVPSEKKHFQQPCVGHVGLRMQLNDLGAFEVARTRDQQLREQLETTRAKLEELWEECQRTQKQRDKLETRLLVAEFEEQVRDEQDREEMRRAKQAQIEHLRKVEAKLKMQEDLNRECITALEDTERTALQEQTRRLALQKENEELRQRLAQLSVATPDRVRPEIKRLRSHGNVSPMRSPKGGSSFFFDKDDMKENVSVSVSLSSASVTMSPGSKISISRCGDSKVEHLK